MGKLEKKIASILESVGVDKVLHFMTVGWITSIGFTYSFTAGVWCFLLIFVLSFIKERYIDDKFDWLDIIAGFFGGWLSFALYWIITELL